MAEINADDLKNQALLSQVAEKLHSQRNAIGHQLVQQRMHDSAWMQHTNTVKVCIKGIDLINSLRTSDSSSRKRCEEVLLGSENKTLAQFLQEAKQQSDQIKSLTMKYKERGECLYKIQKHCDYLKKIVKVSEQTYDSIHKEVTRKDRTIGQAELEAYQKQVSKVKAQLEEELKGMNLKQLEQRYIALGQKVPASFDLEGDYGKSRDKIIRKSSSV